MKKRTVIGIILSSLCLISCGSPESDGKKAARDENNCAGNYIEAVRKLESGFVNRFNPKDYTLRSQAVDEYKRKLNAIGEEYYRNLDAAKIQKSKLKGKYSGDYRKMEQFEIAYNGEKDKDLTASALSLRSKEAVPPAVMACINGIIPPKPGDDLIKANLVGHSLSEGFKKEDCYFSEKWRLDIDEGVMIKDFAIEKVTDNNSREYSFVASMTLQKDYLYFKARARVGYILPDGEDWKIDFVKSLGVKLVQTHKYDDCIRCEINDDGWGGINALFITNNSEVQLLVIGRIEVGRKKRNFNQIILPGEKAQVGGLFSGGSVSDFKIVAVERMS